MHSAKAPPEDNVNHPKHYNLGQVECITAIQAALYKDEFLGYCKGNVLKYVWREKNKGSIEDLKKARFYLDRAIEYLEKHGR